MGNSLEKVFRDDEYEITVRVKKIARDEPPTLSGANAVLNANAGPSQDAPAVTPASGSRVRKNLDVDRVTRSRKVSKVSTYEEDLSESENVAQPEGASPSPRRMGRKVTCMQLTPSGMDMKVLKSHLAPFHIVTVSSEFVDTHGTSFEILNVGQCRTLTVETLSERRYRFNKQQWSQIASELNVQLNDAVHFQMLGGSRVRIEKGLSLVQYAPSGSQTPDPAVEIYSPGVTGGTSGASAAAPAAAPEPDAVD